MAWARRPRSEPPPWSVRRFRGAETRTGTLPQAGPATDDWENAIPLAFFSPAVGGSLNGLASAISPRVGCRRQQNFSIRLRKGCGTRPIHRGGQTDSPIYDGIVISVLIRKAKPFA